MKTSRFAEKLATRLFDTPDEQERFLAAVERGDAARPCAVWLRDRPENSIGPILNHSAKWVPSFATAFEHGFRPGAHPLHAAGAFYSLDLSSVFSAGLLAAIDEPIENALDLCASPGGKTVLLRCFQPDCRITANEAIGSRKGILRENMARCGLDDVEVVSHDPSFLAVTQKGEFDLVVADVPCSGQSLLARGMDNPGCFNPIVTKRNAMRQRRITAAAMDMLRPGGWLLYTTCTFAVEENEEVVEWLLKKRPEFEVVACDRHEDFASRHGAFPCYRLYPQSGLGAGSFGALLCWVN